jgi:hypothetical protein
MGAVIGGIAAAASHDAGGSRRFLAVRSVGRLVAGQRHRLTDAIGRSIVLSAVATSR